MSFDLDIGYASQRGPRTDLEDFAGVVRHRGHCRWRFSGRAWQRGCANQCDGIAAGLLRHPGYLGYHRGP